MATGIGKGLLQKPKTIGFFFAACSFLSLAYYHRALHYDWHSTDMTDRELSSARLGEYIIPTVHGDRESGRRSPFTWGNNQQRRYSVSKLPRTEFVMGGKIERDGRSDVTGGIRSRLGLKNTPNRSMHRSLANRTSPMHRKISHGRNVIEELKSLERTLDADLQRRETLEGLPLNASLHVNDTDFQGLLRKIREELADMAAISSRKALWTYNRSALPKNLTRLGRMIFRMVPKRFLPDYRSPCFYSSTDDLGLVCLPYFFLAGFPKCATTDLYKKLLSHPDIVEAWKEPHWWTRTTFTRASVTHYFGHQRNLIKEMRKGGNKQLITLDASASTLWDTAYSIGKFSLRAPLPFTHADVMRALLPDTRFVVLLRAPSERLYSDYMAFDKLWRREKSPEDFHRRLILCLEDFRQCIEQFSFRTCTQIISHLRLNVGLYSVFIRQWLERFPREQFYILRTEDWAKDPAKELAQIFAFLGLYPLPSSVLKNVTTQGRENKRRDPDVLLGQMLPESKRLLDAFYQPFNEDLSRLLGNDDYLWRTA
ncbi:carbohydrate sulfotransferase 15-like isoform X1 [Diadema setosum]|uniref:carbohydrate sulfotransferase 15-like isoform X1 n=2 Tax=Diadema setosum TaxID=31175 RepID=UPI003B3BAAA6